MDNKKEIINKLKQIDVLNLKNQNFQKAYDFCIDCFKTWCKVVEYPYCVESFYCFLEEFGEIQFTNEYQDAIKSNGYYLFFNLDNNGRHKFSASGLSTLIKEYKYDKLDEYTTNMVTE